MKVPTRSTVVSFFIWIAVAVGWAEDRRPDPNILKIMTYNGEFLWDGVAPEEGNPQVTFPWKDDQAEAEDHMREIADSIIRHNPDIVNMVEVENLEALTRFNDAFLAGRGYRPYLVNGRDTFTGQDVALLTRVDPDNNAIERDDRQGESGDVRKAVSKNYFAKFTVGQRRIAIIGLHFVAFPVNEGRRLERQAQADAMRKLAVELNGQGFSVIVMGDFNDYESDPNAMDHIDSTPITTVLSQVRSMSPENTNDDLVNIASRVPKDSRFTGFHDANNNGEVNPPNEFTSIDHILMAPALAALVEDVRIPHEYDPRNVSDHFPIVATLRLAPGMAPPPVVVPGGPGIVRIHSLLPNPPGNDNDNEEVTLVNSGTQPLNIAQWTLRDRAGKTWSLQALGNLQPGERKTIRRSGQEMALNNTGDTVDLIDPNGVVRDTLTYDDVEEGEVIER